MAARTNTPGRLLPEYVPHRRFVETPETKRRNDQSVEALRKALGLPVKPIDNADANVD